MNDKPTVTEQLNKRAEQRAARARALKARKVPPAPHATDSTRAAHDLLHEITADAGLRIYVAKLETLQHASEVEDWWNKDLGVAVEYTMSHLREALRYADNR